MRGRLAAARLVVAPWGDLGANALSCEHLSWEGSRLRCAAGAAEVGLPGLAGAVAPVSWSYASADGVLELAMHGLGVSKGRLQGQVRLPSAEWSAVLDTQDLEIGSVGFLAAPFLAQAARLEGQATGRATLSGDREGLRHLQVTGTVRSLGLGQHEAIGGRADIAVERTGNGWNLRADARLDAGFYDLGATVLAFPADGLDVAFQGKWIQAKRRLVLSQLRLQQLAVGEMHGSVSLNLGQGETLEGLQIETTGADLAGLWSTYLQPWLGPRLAPETQAFGRVDARLALAAGQPRGRLGLHKVTLDTGVGRYGLAAVDGEVLWDGVPTPGAVDLRWYGGHFYDLVLGPGRLHAVRQGAELCLAEPATLQILDGELRIDKLAVRDLGTPQLAWDLQGTLTPISVEAFSQALGWPVMAGKLSGVIPALHYAQGSAVVEGALLVRVLDGHILVRNLRLDDVFGLLPRLQADVDVGNIDLDALTRTFAFRGIQERLSGYVHELQLVGRRPEAFDARFATPPDDDSRHRVSRKAIDSLTSLGGGIPGALSQGLLRAFDQFGYDRLGLSCRLEQGVCHMDGMGAADNGYYIVVGGGLPRISVVGHAHRVNWNDLVARLLAATRSGGPVIH